MKLRIRGNSLRLRLTKSEAAEIGAGRAVEETVDFGGEPSQKLIYALVPAGEVESATAVFDGGRIAVFIPKAQAAEWARSNRVGIEAEKQIGAETGSSLRILIEKDFACLDRRAGEEDADTFAHPLEKETANPIRLKALE
ncbi:MAG TPA: hypothetical protein VEQ34_09635 [Pyrinomonadaceae bacterium]|nr:hypothetical protein [Pyrinomonadaceae bacterium]